MSKKLKLFLSISLVTVLLSLQLVPVMAQAMPRWDNASMMNISLSFNGNTAQCYVDVMGKTDTTSITGNVTLERYTANGSLTFVKSWNSLFVPGEELTFYDTWLVTKGYKYRLTFTGMVYRNGSGEQISGYMDAECKN